MTLLHKETQDRILLAFAAAAAGAIQISIAASQILLGVGIVLLLLFRRKLPFPRIWIPLLCFFLWTLLADAVSPDPWLGRAQIKKFFVFLFIPLVFSVFRGKLSDIRYLVMIWAAAAGASALWAVIQFLRHAQESYISYVGQRITGFESHWMTFGGLELAVFLLLIAHFFFSDWRMPVWAYSVLPVLALAILLNGTRSIWIAAVPSVLYLVWFWRPKMIWAVPVLAIGGFLVSPHNVRERIVSMVKPTEDVDSNRHRLVTFETGMQMIEAHPWFGIGPEEIGRNFAAYVPANIPKPLPPGYYGHLHNIYLQYAAERGVPGLLFMLWFIGLAVYDALRAALARGRDARSDGLFVWHSAVAVTIGILVGGLFEYNLGDSEVLMMFLCVIALSYAALWAHAHQDVFSPIAQTVSK